MNTKKISLFLVLLLFFVLVFNVLNVNAGPSFVGTRCSATNMDVADKFCREGYAGGTGDYMRAAYVACVPTVNRLDLTACSEVASIVCVEDSDCSSSGQYKHSNYSCVYSTTGLYTGGRCAYNVENTNRNQYNLGEGSSCFEDFQCSTGNCNSTKDSVVGTCLSCDPKTGNGLKCVHNTAFGFNVTLSSYFSNVNLCSKNESCSSGICRTSSGVFYQNRCLCKTSADCINERGEIYGEHSTISTGKRPFCDSTNLCTSELICTKDSDCGTNAKGEQNYCSTKNSIGQNICMTHEQAACPTQTNQECVAKLGPNYVCSPATRACRLKVNIGGNCYGYDGVCNSGMCDLKTNKCAPKIGDSCSSNSDCASNLLCQGNKCTPVKCNSNYQCLGLSSTVCSKYNNSIGNICQYSPCVLGNITKPEDYNSPCGQSMGPTYCSDSRSALPGFCTPKSFAKTSVYVSALSASDKCTTNLGQSAINVQDYVNPQCMSKYCNYIPGQAGPGSCACLVDSDCSPSNDTLCNNGVCQKKVVITSGTPTCPTQIKNYFNGAVSLSYGECATDNSCKGVDLVTPVNISFNANRALSFNFNSNTIACDASRPNCVSGRCSLSCTSNSNCNSGWSCVDVGGKKSCVPPTYASKENGDTCSYGGECKSGKCANLAILANFMTSLGSSMVCIGNIGESCTGTSFCGTNQSNKLVTCYNNLCTGKPNGASCGANLFECASGYCNSTSKLCSNPPAAATPAPPASSLSGDRNGDGLIGAGEICGDKDKNGRIDNPPEIAGDINGNSAIDADEIAGDINCNKQIDPGEFAGDIDGDKIIDPTEKVGDRNGNGQIDVPDETLGDRNNNDRVDSGECGANSDCPRGQSCTAGLCVAPQAGTPTGSGTVPPGGVCDTNNLCISGYSCINGICYEPCNGDKDDCSLANLYCESGYCSGKAPVCKDDAECKTLGFPKRVCALYRSDKASNSPKYCLIASYVKTCSAQNGVTCSSTQTCGAGSKQIEVSTASICCVRDNDADTPKDPSCISKQSTFVPQLNGEVYIVKGKCENGQRLIQYCKNPDCSDEGPSGPQSENEACEAITNTGTSSDVPSFYASAGLVALLIVVGFYLLLHKRRSELNSKKKKRR